jgi:hypothetical protein
MGEGYFGAVLGQREASRGRLGLRICGRGLGLALSCYAAEGISVNCQDRHTGQG